MLHDTVVIEGEVSLISQIDGDPDVVIAEGGGIVPTGTIEITSNGVYNVTEYASADVDVQGGITPTGTKQINIASNGTVTEDVTSYANAEININVPASAVDTGTKNINSNGTHDVVGYANASVNVPNSYSASDEGKVVSNGALVSQTSDTVTANDTYDTTLINSLTVNVSGGGGYTLADIAGGKPSGAVDLTGIQVADFSMSGRSITSITGHVASGSKINGLFFRCASLVTANLILDDSMENQGEGTFQACENLQTIVLICNGSYNNQMNTCNGDRNLKTADVKLPRIRNNFFWNCSSLDTLIIRNTSVVPLENVSLFAQSKFKNGGTGGTIYIPKSLYDHLGDGTANDYQSATNWSTIYGYGTITWATIEGSIYENAYADGTPISS